LAPNALVNTFGKELLFCITKGATAFEVMAEGESQKMFRSSLSGRSKIRTILSPKAH
jgi:hypothetical protein